MVVPESLCFAFFLSSLNSPVSTPQEKYYEHQEKESNCNGQNDCPKLLRAKCSLASRVVCKVKRTLGAEEK